MITIYKKRPSNKEVELITNNDIFFNTSTAELLDDDAKSIIAEIDKSKMDNKYTIRSRFDGTALNIDKLSTGCKTALNVMYNVDKVFDIRECGDNALDVIYSLPEGNVFCDYPLISFDMKIVKVNDNNVTKEFDNYDKLKEWWMNED